ncbi:HAD family phosphatase [Micromonospora sp. WMMD1082]|uniref:HAD family hydrolase n=1 Tax=Micromonospora sp. WMMD1082 TaxID=3016104 RepID=UPI00241671B7|nr:HAD family phosphatase [Micromonospora sp. WMMD1082]MDG4795497.1 HAD family phosphatase [Micromonospora sp. WMMD1082]
MVFDCDGVLVDSETINNEVFAQLATLAGVDTSFTDSVRLYMGRATDECVAELEDQLGTPISFDFAAEYERQVLDQQQNLHPIEGVVTLLRWLVDNKYPICVASSGTPTEIRQKLTTSRLINHFGEHLYSASMVARGKPAPDLFLLAAQRLGIPPESCLVVEDSPFGVRGAKTAGMRVAGFASLASSQLLKDAGADFTVETMAELHRHLAGA